MATSKAAIRTSKDSLHELELKRITDPIPGAAQLTILRSQETGNSDVSDKAHGARRRINEQVLVSEASYVDWTVEKGPKNAEGCYIIVGRMVLWTVQKRDCDPRPSLSVVFNKRSVQTPHVLFHTHTLSRRSHVHDTGLDQRHDTFTVCCKAFPHTRHGRYANVALPTNARLSLETATKSTFRRRWIVACPC